jgi:DNA polymerase III subunit chi
MTDVEFHFNAPDKLGYACRLLRKAAARGARVTVTGETLLLAELDAALWTFSPLDFVPHCQVQGAPPAVLDASPIVLCDSARASPHHEVLLNLGGDVPEGFERFERLIEVVSQEDADRTQARARWKHYASRGYGLKREDLVLKEQP